MGTTLWWEIKFLIFCFCLHCAACGIFVPLPGIKSGALQLKRIPNHWTTREFPGIKFSEGSLGPDYQTDAFLMSDISLGVGKQLGADWLFLSYKHSCLSQITSNYEGLMGFGLNVWLPPVKQKVQDMIGPSSGSLEVPLLLHSVVQNQVRETAKIMGRRQHWGMGVLTCGSWEVIPGD